MELYSDTVIDLEGNVVVGADVLVLNKDKSPANVYDPSGQSVGFIKTGNRGEFYFQAANGDYYIQISVGGVVLVNQGPVTLYDPTEDNERKKLGSIFTLKSFGAIGDGVADDTAAVQKAFDYLVSVGGSLRQTPGYYRLTGPVNIGLPLYSSLSFVIDRSGKLDDSADESAQILANKTANRSKKKIDLICESGSFFVADFSPSGYTAVLSYNLDNDSMDNTGTISGLSIIAKNQVVNGVYQAGQTYAQNNLIGLVCGRGAAKVTNMFFAGLRSPYAFIRPYWVEQRNIKSVNCGDGGHLAGHHSSTAKLITSINCKRGLLYDGQASSVQNYGTENCDTDFELLSGDACRFDTFYLEDVRTSGGEGKSMFMVGTAENLVAATHCTFNNIMTLCTQGSKKKSFRIWGAAGVSFNGCRSYGSPVVVDSNSYGTLSECDFNVSNGKLTTLVKEFPSFAITPVLQDSEGHVFSTSVAVGESLKIGRLAYATMTLAWTSIGSANASPLVLSGLSLAAKSISNYSQAATIGYMSGFDTVSGSKQIVAYVVPGAKYLVFKQINDNGPPTDLAANSLSASGEIRLSISYLPD